MSSALCCSASSWRGASVVAPIDGAVFGGGLEQRRDVDGHEHKTDMVHGTWYRANSGQANVKAPSHAVPHAARWRRPRHALRPQHAARSSARLPKHGAVGRRGGTITTHKADSGSRSRHRAARLTQRRGALFRAVAATTTRDWYLRCCPGELVLDRLRPQVCDDDGRLHGAPAPVPHLPNTTYLSYSGAG
eukprot:scaffold96600_cov63-Phaeocystis_antarctica.AAC.3